MTDRIHDGCVKTTSRWRQAIAHAYYWTSYPGRRWYEQRLAAAGRAPITVLTFHRVADDRANRWTIPTADFVAAVKWLKSRFELISLAEVQRRVREGLNARPSASITFDDGYADNCRLALPLLIAEGIPCTYFVTSGAVLHGQPFAHDTQMGNGHLALNTVAQLRDLVHAGVEIGAHTRTHRDLAAVTDAEVLRDELATCRTELEAALDTQVRYFAFPFGAVGNLTCAAFAVARAAGYAAACSAYGGWNYPGDDPFHIRRRGVDGPLNRTKNWTLIDPLRERSLPAFACADESLSKKARARE